MTWEPPWKSVPPQELRLLCRSEFAPDFGTAAGWAGCLTQEIIAVIFSLFATRSRFRRCCSQPINPAHDLRFTRSSVRKRDEKIKGFWVRFQHPGNADEKGPTERTAQMRQSLRQLQAAERALRRPAALQAVRYPQSRERLFLQRSDDNNLPARGLSFIGEESSSNAAAAACGY